MSDSNFKTVVFGLFGAGGYAREVMPLVENSLKSIFNHDSKVLFKVYFVELHPENDFVNSYRVLSEKYFFDIPCDFRYFNVAISDSKLRKKLSDYSISKGAFPLEIRAGNVIVYDNNDIQEGAIISAHCVVTSNAIIGRFFNANIFSYVAHDCVIGDFVTFAPNVHCNGYVHIKDHAYIGTGAIIKQGSPFRPIVIGEGAIVGMGAVVTRDVDAYTTVIGNPAKPLIKS